MRKPLMQEFSTVPAGAVRSVLRSFMVQEAEFRERAEVLSREEPLSTVQDRFLELANRPEFPEFFAFLSRRADDLLAPCHWLAMGSNLLEEREARIPTAAELIRLVQLIRHQRPDLLDFVRTLVIRSPLATIAASVAPSLATESQGLSGEVAHGA